MTERVQRPLQLFSREKLLEFRDMSIRARLQWLEEANDLMLKIHGKEKLAYSDSRYIIS